MERQIQIHDEFLRGRSRLGRSFFYIVDLQPRAAALRATRCGSHKYRLVCTRVVRTVLRSRDLGSASATVSLAKVTRVTVIH